MVQMLTPLAATAISFGIVYNLEGGRFQNGGAPLVFPSEITASCKQNKKNFRDESHYPLEV